VTNALGTGELQCRKEGFLKAVVSVSTIAKQTPKRSPDGWAFVLQDCFPIGHASSDQVSRTKG
jgi:hypothetical protein